MDLYHKVFDPDGKVRVLPYSEYADVPPDSLAILGNTCGLWCFPTVELIDFLREEIGGLKAIEIGAGNGAISRALGITATDSRAHKSHPNLKEMYSHGVYGPPPYQDDVHVYEALAAVRRFKPAVVVASWCTHKYNHKEHWRSGFEDGVDEGKLLERVRKYIFIGSDHPDGPHVRKPILKLPHRTIKAPWILSRTQYPDSNVIWIWEEGK